MTIVYSLPGLRLKETHENHCFSLFLAEGETVDGRMAGRIWKVVRIDVSIDEYDGMLGRIDSPFPLFPLSPVVMISQ